MTRRFEILDRHSNRIGLVLGDDPQLACRRADALVEAEQASHAYVVEFPCDEAGDYDQCRNLGPAPGGGNVVSCTIYASVDWI